MKQRVIFLFIVVFVSFFPYTTYAANCKQNLKIDFTDSNIPRNSRPAVERDIEAVYDNTCRFLESIVGKKISNAILEKIMITKDLKNNGTALQIGTDALGAKEAKERLKKTSGFYYYRGELIILEEQVLNTRSYLSHEIIHSFHADTTPVYKTNFVQEGLVDHLAIKLYGYYPWSYQYPIETIRALIKVLDSLGYKGEKEITGALLDQRLPTRINELLNKYVPKDTGALEAKTAFQYLNFNLQIEQGERKNIPKNKHADLVGWLNGIGKEAKTETKALDITAQVSGKQVTLTVKNIPRETKSVTVKEGDKKLTTKAVDGTRTTSSTIVFSEDAAGQHSYSIFALDDTEKRIGEGNKSVTVSSTSPTPPGSSTPPAPSATTRSTPTDASTSSSQTLSTPVVALGDFGLGTFLNEAKKLYGLGGGDQFYLPLAVKIINFLLTIAAAAAVIFGLWSGILIMGSFGDEQKIATAKQNLINVALGLVLVAFAFTIVNLVNGFLVTGRI